MAKNYSREVKQKACDLRTNGWSIGEISHKMQVPKNTLSGWLKKIQLTKEQKDRIRQKIAASGATGRLLAVKANREKIERWKLGIKGKVKHFGQLVQKDPEIGRIICGILYLCEGAKYPSSTAMTFGNSDPKIIQTFLYLLRRYFPVREEKLHCRIIPRWDQDLNELQCFWSHITRIPLTNFYKTQPDKRTKGKATNKKDYKGICAVSYCNTSLQFELQSIGEAIINGRL
ncbi:MAG: hypothetical protein ISS45_09750 [Candidatus Omnitrophica bacterium]|nr:hypothetical protein [Candidatus Omnitrophota bacterium]